jgi:hypothetical protein
VFCQINTEDKFLLWFSKLQKREPDFANELFDRISDIMKLLKVLDTSKTQNLDLTIVKKIVLCKYIAPHVGNLPDKCREPRLIIHCKDPHIIPYKTTKHNGKSPWKILRKNRIYNETEKHNHNIQYNIPRCEILTNWLFYASFSPVWEKRILKYGGNVDIENRKIIFETGEKEDLFQQHYGYDLDEQPAIFQPHDTALCREYNENIDEIACSTNNDYFS